METGESRGPHDFVFVAKMKTEGQVLLCENREFANILGRFLSSTE